MPLGGVHPITDFEFLIFRAERFISQAFSKDWCFAEVRAFRVFRG